MKLSKDQLKELKKIDSSYQQIEEITEKAGIKLDDIVAIFNFGEPDLLEQERERVFNKNRSRQQVFEQSQTPAKKTKVISHR